MRKRMYSRNWHNIVNQLELKKKKKKKKKGNPAICNNMDETGSIMFNEISQTEKDTVWYHLYVKSF